MAYFVVPLPEPLGLPDKHRVVCTTPTPSERYRQHEAEGWPVPPPEHMTASLLFHHAESESAIVGVTDRLFALAHEVFPDPEAEPAGETALKKAKTPVPLMPRTFVEMAVAFEPDDSDNGGVSGAFDAGLVYVREVQRAYYLIRRRPIRLATREAMPYAIPYGARRLFDEDGETAPFRVPLSMFVLHMNVDREARDEELTTTQLQGLVQGLYQQAHPGVHWVPGMLAANSTSRSRARAGSGAPRSRRLAVMAR